MSNKFINTKNYVSYESNPFYLNEIITIYRVYLTFNCLPCNRQAIHLLL